MPGFYQSDVFKCKYCGKKDFKTKRGKNLHEKFYCSKRPKSMPNHKKKWME